MTDATPAEGRLQIVGIDGSPGSIVALRWALERAERLGPVKPVSAWHYPWWALVPTATGTMAPPAESEFQGVAERVLAHALDEVGQGADGGGDGLVVDPEVVHGTAGSVLVEAAGEASLLVVGSRGRGAVAGSLLGSVSLHCVNHASVPVAIIPDDTEIGPGPGADRAGGRFDRVVVGIDGSDNGQRALEWALDHAMPGARIDVVNAWDPGAVVAAEVAILAAEEGEKRSREVVAESLAAANGKITASGHRVEGYSRRGDPRRLLRAEAERADLLVVGARGYEGIAHLLLGSVTTALVHHPNTPTVVVR